MCVPGKKKKKEYTAQSRSDEPDFQAISGLGPCERADSICSPKSWSGNLHHNEPGQEFPFLQRTTFDLCFMISISPLRFFSPKAPSPFHDRGGGNSTQKCNKLRLTFVSASQRVPSLVFFFRSPLVQVPSWSGRSEHWSCIRSLCALLLVLSSTSGSVANRCVSPLPSFVASLSHPFVLPPFASQVAVLKGHMATITHLQGFGDHLLSVDRDSVLKMWDVSEWPKMPDQGCKLKAIEPVCQIDLGPDFNVTCIV